MANNFTRMLNHHPVLLSTVDQIQWVWHLALGWNRDQIIFKFCELQHYSLKAFIPASFVSVFTLLSFESTRFKNLNHLQCFPYLTKINMKAGDQNTRKRPLENGVNLKSLRQIQDVLRWLKWKLKRKAINFNMEPAKQSKAFVSTLVRHQEKSCREEPRFWVVKTKTTGKH